MPPPPPMGGFGGPPMGGFGGPPMDGCDCSGQFGPPPPMMGPPPIGNAGNELKPPVFDEATGEFTPSNTPRFNKVTGQWELFPIEAGTDGSRRLL